MSRQLAGPGHSSLETQAGHAAAAGLAAPALAQDFPSLASWGASVQVTRKPQAGSPCGLGGAATGVRVGE